MRTEIGHFAIEYDSVTYELYPTFKNMRKLCDPKEMPNFLVAYLVAKLKQLPSLSRLLTVTNTLIQSVKVNIQKH